MNANLTSTILIVEDDRSSLKLLEGMLTKEGYVTQLAAGIEDATSAIALRLPDLILLDIYLPRVDGFEICRKLKDEEKTRQIPVIFISGTSDSKERVEGFRLGAVDFVSKPFQREELIARIETHLTLARLQADLKKQRNDLRLINDQLQREMLGREEALASLLQSEDRLNLALEAAQMGTWDLNLTTGKLWSSRLNDRIFGYTVQSPEWNRETFIQHIAVDDRPKVENAFRESFQTDQFQGDWRIQRAEDKAERWIHIEAKIRRDKDRAPIRMMGIVVDITERVLAEQERQAIEVQTSISQKLESVGRLASGIAHEINTPTQFISDNIQFLKGAVTSLTNVLVAYRALSSESIAPENLVAALKSVRETEEINELDYLLSEIPQTLEETVSGFQRVTQIVRSLKEFAHPNKDLKQPADLNHAIETTIAVARHEWKYVADVATELDPDLPKIPLRIDEMNQVILNLIVNAAHAIADTLGKRDDKRGTITVRTKCVEKQLQIEVQDDGTGIPEAAQAHIFEPFFTTKGVGKGTGQGLAIIRTIVVKNHGGTISFTTAVGQGTTFTIRLPLPNAA
jgi:two-component system NtrC family sensor kinase